MVCNVQFSVFYGGLRPLALPRICLPGKNCSVEDDDVGEVGLIKLMQERCVFSPPNSVNSFTETLAGFFVNNALKTRGVEPWFQIGVGWFVVILDDASQIAGPGFVAGQVVVAWTNVYVFGFALGFSTNLANKLADIPRGVCCDYTPVIQVTGNQNGMKRAYLLF